MLREVSSSVLCFIFNVTKSSYCRLEVATIALRDSLLVCVVFCQMFFLMLYSILCLLACLLFCILSGVLFYLVMPTSIFTALLVDLPTIPSSVLLTAWLLLCLCLLLYPLLFLSGQLLLNFLLRRFRYSFWLPVCWVSAIMPVTVLAILDPLVRPS